MPSLVELSVADAPAGWAALGFTVAGDETVVGGVRIKLLGSGASRGISGWAFEGIDGARDLDGLATSAGQPPRAAAEHANGAVGVDHVVVFTPSLARTYDAFRGAG